jgi:hypothetical protein
VRSRATDGRPCRHRGELYRSELRAGTRVLPCRDRGGKLVHPIHHTYTMYYRCITHGTINLRVYYGGRGTLLGLPLPSLSLSYL